MKIYFGTKRRGMMTSKGIMIDDKTDAFLFFHMMYWRFWGVKFGQNFIGLMRRVEN